jgi:hypothetical protein
MGARGAVARLVQALKPLFIKRLRLTKQTKGQKNTNREPQPRQKSYNTPPSPITQSYITIPPINVLIWSADEYAINLPYTK